MNPIDIVKAAVTAINEGRIDDALAYYADSVVQQSPDPRSADFKVRKGKEALRQVLQTDIHGPAKCKFRYNRIIGSGNIVAAEGTNCGYVGGVYVEQPVALFYELADSKIQTVTIYYDRLALRRILEESATGTEPGASAD